MLHNSYFLIVFFAAFWCLNAEEECMKSTYWCYECDTWNDLRCHDPFNTSAHPNDLPPLKQCEGCCVKIVMYAGTWRKLGVKLSAVIGIRLYGAALNKRYQVPENVLEQSVLFNLWRQLDKTESGNRRDGKDQLRVTTINKDRCLVITSRCNRNSRASHMSRKLHTVRKT
ncbi:protein quiver [Trichonephila clavipes]|nr:protein quiver [Trichonephila clavipes]